MGTLPRGLGQQSFKNICQFYEGKPRFVTQYTFSHIPVYSAYTFKHSDGFKKADVLWMYEQQAVLDDYTESVIFERGQLNPDEHQAHPDDKAATYTLINVVPQVEEFHMGPWKKHEHIIRRRLNNYCRSTAYMVTGVTTSGHTIRRQNIKRLGIPSYFW
ncbi:unnamed protein product [Pleuronectes platessa]|uniref:DNA/RNA non-specific endonuclease/pyrophosphatase/phosphodiesterase domain-containing protein n=1 Tax=Pleuronectes platessa TaxID=8262 RepID=A0A9N7VVH8_PLEPL|nr:unnamed protein product [Pleuronectes platessa]